MTRLKVALRGQPLLFDPSLNKGTAFTRREREEFGLVGMLPLQSNTLQEQQARAYEQYRSHGSDLGKNTFLQSLKGEFQRLYLYQLWWYSMLIRMIGCPCSAQNWVLFYSLILRHLKEMFPIIYTRKSTFRSHTWVSSIAHSGRDLSCAICTSLVTCSYRSPSYLPLQPSIQATGGYLAFPCG
jgi:hypothetical protein